MNILRNHKFRAERAALIERWRAAWPQALAAWSKFTRLRDARLCESRVDAARFGAMKAVLPLKGTVAASDAFFPFPDGLETIVEAGATAVIQPGGSVRDDAVVEAADRLGIAMVFTGIRHFRH